MENVLQNRDYFKTQLPTIPTVGMGATLMLWSDRHAYTILEISKDTYAEKFVVDGKTVILHMPKWVKASRDTYKRIDVNGPYSGDQTYEHITNYSIKQARIFAYNKKTKSYRDATYISSGDVSQKERERALAEDRLQTFTSKASSTMLHIGSKETYYDPSF